MLKKIVIFFYFLLISTSAFGDGKIKTHLSQTSLETIAESGYWIEVQIPQRKLILAKGSQVVKSFPIAVGDPKFPSPIGMRMIDKIIWNPWWVPPKESSWVSNPTPIAPRSSDNPLGEIKIPLGDSYLIHGTKAAESIGNWASHGCFRMLFEDLFSLVQILSNEYAKESALTSMERANTDETTEFAVALTRTIPVSIVYEPIMINDGYVSISPDFYGIFAGPPTPGRSQKTAGLQNLLIEMMRPYLKDGATPNNHKIKNVLRTFRGKTIEVPINNLL